MCLRPQRLPWMWPRCVAAPLCPVYPHRCQYFMVLSLVMCVAVWSGCVHSLCGKTRGGLQNKSLQQWTWKAHQGPPGLPCSWDPLEPGTHHLQEEELMWEQTSALLPKRASNPCSWAALSPRDRDNSAQHRVILSFLVATLKEKLKS